MFAYENSKTCWDSNFWLSKCKTVCDYLFRTIGFYIVFLLHSYCQANNNGHYILNWFRFVRILDNKLKITAIQAQNYFSYSKPYNFPISSLKRNKLPRKQGFCIPNFEPVYYNNISKIEGDNYFIHLVDVNWLKNCLRVGKYGC